MNTTIYENARIYTVSGAGWEKRPAEAMAVGEDGKILAIGRLDDVRATVAADTYTIVDLEGAAVLPGFIDTHVHAPGDALTRLFDIYLYDCRDLEDTCERIRDFIKENPGKDLYYGSGFYLSIAGGRPEGPRKEWLDDIEADKAIVLESSDGHSFWLNSAALRRFGIDKNTPNPTGGLIQRDALSGEPSGTLTDVPDITSVRPKYSSDETEKAFALYQDKMTGWGYTSAMHMAPPLCDPSAMKKLLDCGLWRMRVNMCALAEPDMSIADTFEELKKYESLFADEPLIKTSTVKFFEDGVVEGRTAFLKEAYAQIQPGEPEGYRSEPIWDMQSLAERMAVFTKDGYQIHVHSIGDAATAEAIEAIRIARGIAGKPAGNRDVLTHLQLLDKEEIEAMKELSLIASYQPFWHFKEPNWYDEIDLAALGEKRAEAAYPVGSVVRAGIPVTFSGDYPVSPVNNPFWAIQNAVTRNIADAIGYGVEPLVHMDEPKWLRNADERISLPQAIEAYTINSAYQLFREHEIGSLEAGKQADFIVTDRDPFEQDPAFIYETTPTKVFIGGRLIRRRDCGSSPQ